MAMTWKTMLKYRKRYNLTYLKQMRDSGHEIAFYVTDNGLYGRPRMEMWVDGHKHVSFTMFKQDADHYQLRKATLHCLNIGLNKPIAKRTTHASKN